MTSAGADLRPGPPVMHEMSVAQNIIDIVQQAVPSARTPAVTSVRVRLGSLSGVVAESLAFCFDALVADTAMARARLVIERVPTACDCRACGTRFEPDALIFFCPACGGGDVRLVSGRDLQVVDVELDDAADQDAPEASPCP
jgi:hydrogenase nickel incorporation protein HypA/HybF